MLTTMEMPNVARDLNRSAKARALADTYAEKLDGSPTQAACLDQDGRDALAIEAGTTSPSAATWSAVVAVLEDRAVQYPSGRMTLPCGHAPGQCNGHNDSAWGASLRDKYGDGEGL